MSPKEERNSVERVIFSGPADDLFLGGGSQSSVQELRPVYMNQVGCFARLTAEEELAYMRQFIHAREALHRLVRQFPLLMLYELQYLAQVTTSVHLNAYIGKEDAELDPLAAEDEGGTANASLRGKLREKLVNLPPVYRDDKSIPCIPRQCNADAIGKSLSALPLKDAFYSECLNLLDNEELLGIFIPQRRRKALVEDIKDLRTQMHDAQSTMVEHNLRLVISVARSYPNGSLPLSDLVQEGNLGLLKAVERFDPERGHRFGTYAMFWIRQAIIRAISNNGRIIRMPANIMRQIAQIRQAEVDLLAETGNQPSSEEIAERTQLSPARVRALQKMSQQPLSLQTIVHDEQNMQEMVQDGSLGSPSANIDFANLQDSLRKAMGHLSDRERLIITMRFGLDGNETQTFAEISDKLNLTGERVRQIMKKALDKLRISNRSFHYFEGY